MKNASILSHIMSTPATIGKKLFPGVTGRVEGAAPLCGTTGMFLP